VDLVLSAALDGLGQLPSYVVHRTGRRCGVLLATLGLALSVVPVAPAAATEAHESRLEVSLRHATGYALRQLARTDRRLRPGRFPTVAVGDAPWRTSGTNGWLAGFWPGRLWLAYELTGDRHWARRSVAQEAPLVVRADDTSTHDLGFLLQTSFGRGARLLGRRTDDDVVRRGAAALASRYVPVAAALRSWDGPPGQVTVIVDSLMNLELLFEAADLGGPTRWRDLALQHALTVARWHVRPDGSTFHVVRFDESTGLPVWQGTVQGLADDSTWARGQAWAVHGFTTAYRETGDPRLLAAARRTASFAVAHLPRDGVPWWDYDAPGTRRDTTAAAVLASGLLELARLDPDAADRARWRAAGLHTLGSLVGPRYLARGTGAWSVLLHGRHDRTYDDAGVTYGDHYLLEALLRVQLLPAEGPSWRAAAQRRLAGGGMRVDLGGARRVSAVSVRWRDGSRTATRFRVQASADGLRWTTVRAGLSSVQTAGAETYDVRDRTLRYLRVRPLGASDGTRGRVLAVRARR
jgi:unsaturated chondroitin disaccharide hydrolase